MAFISLFSGARGAAGLSLILGAVLLTACAPVVPNEPRAAEFKALSLVYNAYTYAACSFTAQPRLTAQENGTDIPLDVFPARTTILLQERRSNSDPSGSPNRVTLIPLGDTTVADFAGAYPQLAVQAARLARLLAARPVLPAAPDAIPDLAVIDCERLMLGRPEFVDFQGGHGFLFLTQYVQEFSPITNAGLTAVYQGLTADGRHYIDARFAVTHPTLPQSAASARPVAEGRRESYLKTTTEELNHFPGNSYVPLWDEIKSTIQSIQVK